MKIIDKLIDRLAVRVAEEIVARQPKPTYNITNNQAEGMRIFNQTVRAMAEDTRSIIHPRPL